MVATRRSFIFILSFILRQTNIILHCGCFYGLYCCISKRTSPQVLLVFCLNAIQLIRSVVYIPLLYDQLFRSIKLRVYRHYLRFNVRVTIQLFHYILILYLMMNMIFVEILLRKYKRYCTIARTKLLLLMTSLFFLFFGSVFCLLAALDFFSIKHTPSIHLMRILFHSAFIVLSIVFYYALCRRNDKRPLTLRIGRRTHRNSIFWKVKRHGILISFLIIINFGSIVIPSDVIDTILFYTTRRVPILWMDIRLFITTVSDFIDIVLYLLCNKRFRLILNQLLRNNNTCFRQGRRRFRSIALTKVSPTVITPSTWGTPSPTNAQDSRFNYTSPGITPRNEFLTV